MATDAAEAQRLVGLYPPRRPPGILKVDTHEFTRPKVGHPTREIYTDTRATHTTASPPTTPTEDELRAVAIKRAKTKRDFRSHLFIYIVINIGLWSIWIIDSIANQWEFPWPVFPIVIWGLFVLGHANDVYRRDPLREDLVQQEIENHRAASKVHPLDTYDLDDDDIC